VDESERVSSATGWIEVDVETGKVRQTTSRLGDQGGGEGRGGGTGARTVVV
jgi:hypothetical protein